MKPLLSALVVVASLGTVHAQPGATQPVDPNADPNTAPDASPYPPPPPAQTYPPPPHQPFPQNQPPPPPGYGVPAPQQYVPVVLTPDEQKLLARGEITDGAHVGGALASLFLGLGVGQAIQGRWGETGWIFTLGELASFTAIMVGAARAFEDCFGVDETCNNNDGEGLFWAGLVGILVFRAWEVVDAFGGPPKHNAKVRELRMRLGMPMPMYTRLAPYVNTTRDGGGVAGVTFRF